MAARGRTVAASSPSDRVAAPWRRRHLFFVDILNSVISMTSLGNIEHIPLGAIDDTPGNVAISISVAVMIFPLGLPLGLNQRYEGCPSVAKALLAAVISLLAAKLPVALTSCFLGEVTIFMSSPVSEMASLQVIRNSFSGSPAIYPTDAVAAVTLPGPLRSPSGQIPSLTCSPS